MKNYRQMLFRWHFIKSNSTAKAKENTIIELKNLILKLRIPRFKLTIWGRSECYDASKAEKEKEYIVSIQ